MACLLKLWWQFQIYSPRSVLSMFGQLFGDFEKKSALNKQMSYITHVCRVEITHNHDGCFSDFLKPERASELRNLVLLLTVTEMYRMLYALYKWCFPSVSFEFVHSLFRTLSYSQFLVSTLSDLHLDVFLCVVAGQVNADPSYNLYSN